MVHTCNPVHRRLRQEDSIWDQSGQDTHTNIPSQKRKKEKKGKRKEEGQEGGKAGRQGGLLVGKYPGPMTLTQLCSGDVHMVWNKAEIAVGGPECNPLLKMDMPGISMREKRSKLQHAAKPHCPFSEPSQNSMQTVGLYHMLTETMKYDGLIIPLVPEGWDFHDPQEKMQMGEGTGSTHQERICQDEASAGSRRSHSLWEDRVLSWNLSSVPFFLPRSQWNCDSHGFLESHSGWENTEDAWRLFKKRGAEGWWSSPSGVREGMVFWVREELPYLSQQDRRVLS